MREHQNNASGAVLRNAGSEESECERHDRQANHSIVCNRLHERSEAHFALSSEEHWRCHVHVQRTHGDLGRQFGKFGVLRPLPLARREDLIEREREAA